MLTRIYLDTVTIIAAIEGDSDEISGRLAELMTREETACVSSELALAEALVGVWRPDKRQDWLALAYERLFSRGDTLSTVRVGREILIRAARLRAVDLSLKLPDAIQLATALEEGCQLLLSNDRKLLRSGAAHGLSTCSLNAADLDALLARIAAS